MITIVDYGMGNLGSVLNMLGRLGIPARTSSQAADILAASKLILPGVGAFDTGMRQIRERGLVEPLREAVMEKKTPLLGICLGMQLLARQGEEGQTQGLGWIDGSVVRLQVPPLPRLRVPHMGWNRVDPRPDSRLFRGLPECPRFYFVHSFHFVPENPADVLAYSTYGSSIVSAVEHANLLGVQFHPEKSHRFGMQLLSNFGELY